MDSRLPKLLFVVLALYAAVHFSYYYPLLPGVVASHFNGRGVANGCQAKPAFFGVFAGVSVLAAVIGFVTPRIISAMPPQLINLPNKTYWLAPDHLAETQAFLNNYFAWFGCAIYLVMIIAFDYAVQSNLHADHPPAVARLWYVLSGFLGFMIVWLIRMFARFGQQPHDNVSLK